MNRSVTASLLASALLLLAANGQAANWVAGTHYSVLPQAQRTSVPAGKIEVLEVFSYGCPHCRQFQTTIKKLKEVLPANAQITYLPASWNKAEAWPVFQRAYLTAQALGVADKAHEAMYEAIWKTGELGVTDNTTGRLKSQSELPTIEDAARFYQRVTGVNAEMSNQRSTLPMMSMGPVTSGRSVLATPLTVLLLVTMLTGLPLCDWSIAAICQPSLN